MHTAQCQIEDVFTNATTVTAISSHFSVTQDDMVIVVINYKASMLGIMYLMHDVNCSASDFIAVRLCYCCHRH